MPVHFSCAFEEMVSVENLLEAWNEFVRGKRAKRDVQEFSLRFTDNILTLHLELVNRTYRHGGYYAFNISDPKPRNIHKASVRDRLVHHAVHRALYPFFTKTFLCDSHSSQKGKGTHMAMDRFRALAFRESRNHTRTLWVLKCDVRKFFASIDHEILCGILTSYIADENILWLLHEIVGSFASMRKGAGLPLGNLTSQLLVNIYMTPFDNFIKHTLRIRSYVRYADDFILLSPNREMLYSAISPIREFLRGQLRLELHPDKIFLKTMASGVDFLGWVHFPDHRVLRTSTKRRMFSRLAIDGRPVVLESYRGLLRRGNAQKLNLRISLPNTSNDRSKC